MLICEKCGRTKGEHSREALTSQNPKGWVWRDLACPVGDGPFHPTQVFTSEAENVKQITSQYSSDLWRAYRLCEEIANLLAGPHPWTDAARLKASEYATYFHTAWNGLAGSAD